MSLCVTLGNQRKPNSGSLEKTPLVGRTFPHPDISYILGISVIFTFIPELVSVPLSVVTSVERESNSATRRRKETCASPMMRMRRWMRMSQSIVFMHKEALSVGWLPVAGTLQHSVLLITLYVYLSMAQGHCNTEFYSSMLAQL